MTMKCANSFYIGDIYAAFNFTLDRNLYKKTFILFPLRKAIECLWDECLEVRQSHDLGVLPLVQDVVDANLADVEDAVVVEITACRQLPRISLTQALGKQNLV